MSSDDVPEVHCHLDDLLSERGTTTTELSRRTGITSGNLSVLENDQAKAIRMTTVAAICATLDVTSGELLVLDDAGRR